MSRGREGRRVEPRQGEPALAHGSQPWRPTGITWGVLKTKKQSEVWILL